jgi:hypothetical protein
MLRIDAWSIAVGLAYIIDLYWYNATYLETAQTIGLRVWRHFTH